MLDFYTFSKIAKDVGDLGKFYMQLANFHRSYWSKTRQIIQLSGHTDYETLIHNYAIFSNFATNLST